MAKSNVSDSMMTGRWASKWAKIVAVVKRLFGSSNAFSALGFYTHFSDFLVNSVSGRATRE